MCMCMCVYKLLCVQENDVIIGSIKPVLYPRHLFYVYEHNMYLVLRFYNIRLLVVALVHTSDKVVEVALVELLAVIIQML